MFAALIAPLRNVVTDRWDLLLENAALRGLTDYWGTQALRYCVARVVRLHRNTC